MRQTPTQKKKKRDLRTGKFLASQPHQHTTVNMNHINMRRHLKLQDTRSSDMIDKGERKEE
jgi:hypothetical protein